MVRSAKLMLLSILSTCAAGFSPAGAYAEDVRVHVAAGYSMGRHRVLWGPDLAMHAFDLLCNKREGKRSVRGCETCNSGHVPKFCAAYRPNQCSMWGSVRIDCAQGMLTRLLVESAEGLTRNASRLIDMAHHLPYALGVGRGLDQHILLLLLLPCHRIPVFLLTRASISPVTRHRACGASSRACSVSAKGKTQSPAVKKVLLSQLPCDDTDADRLC